MLGKKNKPQPSKPEQPIMGRPISSIEFANNPPKKVSFTKEVEVVLSSLPKVLQTDGKDARASRLLARTTFQLVEKLAQNDAAVALYLRKFEHDYYKR